MSIMHNIAYRLFYRNKREYDSGNPPDYNNKREMDTLKNFFFTIPKEIRLETQNIDDIYIEYLSKEDNRKNKLIFYIHGGGFVTGSAQERRAITVYIANKLGYNVAAVNYRLAPEYPFPTAPEDCLKAYKILLKRYQAKDIIFMGESAGGNLALSLALMIKEQNLPKPTAVIAFSPPVQFGKILPSYIENEKTDCILSAKFIQEVQEQYFQSEDQKILCHPYGSPYYGDLKGLPAILLIASRTEMLFEDSRMMYQALKKAGVDVLLKIRDKVMHRYISIPYFKEAKQDLEYVKQYLDEKFSVIRE